MSYSSSMLNSIKSMAASVEKSALQSQAQTSYLKLSASINFLQLLLSSPQGLLFATIAIILMCALIYIFIEFFSRNRLRGISMNLFTKMITVTDYINKFNSQMYSDFMNIKKYEDTRRNLLISSFKDIKYINKVFYENDTLNKISDFMKDITTQQQFNQKINKFFQPNPSFESEITDAEEKNLKSIFNSLYGDEFHKKFSEWFNYNSIWNFVYTSKNEGNLQSNLLTLDSNTKVDELKTIIGKISENVIETTSTQMEEYADALKKLVVYKTTFKIFENMKKKRDKEVAELNDKLKNLIEESVNTTDAVEKKKIDDEMKNINDKIDSLKALDNHESDIITEMNTLFVSDTEIDYASISQRLEESCSILKDGVKDRFLNSFKETSLTQNGLNDIIRATSFIQVLNKLHKSNYTVNGSLLNGIRNVHSHIRDTFNSINVNDSDNEKASTIYNACFEVFNELIYTQTMDNGVGEFMFIDPTTNDINDLTGNELYDQLIQYFNVHTILRNKNNIEAAKDFNTKKYGENKIDKNTNLHQLASETHVSIARLKYLIQDYFVIIMEYNDKSFPDKNDIRDFWEKRVNDFGIPVVGTKKFNRPRDAPDIDYVSTRTNRSRKNKDGTKRKLFNEDGNVMDDLDQTLKKNTPWELYKEYLSAIFSMRHPKIPLFQSIIAGIRYMFPDPNTVLDNFLAQLRGKAPAPSSKRINFDFSFKYDPYTRVMDGMIDRFSDPEAGADKMQDQVDVTTHDDQGVTTAAGSTSSKVDTSGTNAKSDVSSAAETANTTSIDPSSGVVEDDAEEESEKDTTNKCGPDEVSSYRNTRGGRQHFCKSKAAVEIERKAGEKKAQVLKQYENNNCGPNEIASYRPTRGGRQQLFCKPKPQPACPPGKKLERYGRGGMNKRCV